VIEEGTNGRDRDRTDDLYRVKVTLVVYVIDSLYVFLHIPGRFCVVPGAYWTQIGLTFYCLFSIVALLFSDAIQRIAG
jgi:hypothetical protein